LSSDNFQKIAQALLDACLGGRRWSNDHLDTLLDAALSFEREPADQASDALFRILIEGIADQFEPRLSESYAEIASRAIARALRGHDAGSLVERYHRIRTVRPYRGDAISVGRVYVLSRVTLGADVAITSVMLNAAKRRFPGAEIYLAGGEKSRDLFASDARIRWRSATYGRRGTLRERLAAGEALALELSRPDAIVIDPESRLTQLGLLPVCPESRYFLFESRAYGGSELDSLTRLAQRWAAEVFGIDDAVPYVAPIAAQVMVATPYVVVNLGVGGNHAKRVSGSFERELLNRLSRKARVVADLGAGPEEEERVRRAIEDCGAPEGTVEPWRGSFAELAALVGNSSLYVGYDSGGQHAAAVCGTPLVTVFAGFASPRMFARWCPTGPGPKEVIRVESADPEIVLEQTVAAVDRLIPGRAA
jgi:ADP-heptose:LPS heptosyltransferase